MDLDAEVRVHPSFTLQYNIASKYRGTQTVTQMQQRMVGRLGNHFEITWRSRTAKNICFGGVRNCDVSGTNGTSNAGDPWVELWLLQVTTEV